MSVVILGGNECMAGRYEDICRDCRCKAKVYLKNEKGVQNFGNPDLIILFTGAMSHKMLSAATEQAKKRKIQVVRRSSGSVAALRSILNDFINRGVSNE